MDKYSNQSHEKFSNSLNKLLITICAIFTTAAQADDFQIASNIESVTVYQRGAEVTRIGQMSIPAGEHRLIFENLPQGIDPQRLRISIDSNDVRLGNLRLEEIHLGELVNEEERRIQEELDQLLYERQEIADLIEATNTQLKLLSSLADGSVGGQQTSLAVNEVTELLQTLSSSSIQARTVIRDANRDLVLKNREIEQKQFELSQVATRESSEQMLTVAVDTDVPVASSINITYAVRQASWNWLYEARLDTQLSTLSLVRNVSVSQSSGEDWSNVALKITTARPTEQTAAPEIESVYVDFFNQRPANRSTAANRTTEFGITNDAEIQEVMVTGSYLRRSYSNIIASQYLVEFEIPGRISVSADSQQQILPIDEQETAVDLVHRTIPELDENAYLEARFILESNEPLQAGNAQLYRDGAFIGSRGFPSFLPEDEVSMSFGQDELVRIEAFYDPEDSRDGGTFRRTAVEESRQRYRIVSFHNDPIDLEILARIPVSRNQDIDVEILDDATPFDVDEVDGMPGVSMWSRQVLPNNPVELNHYYRVRFPEDQQLDYENR